MVYWKTGISFLGSYGQLSRHQAYLDPRQQRPPRQHIQLRNTPNFVHSCGTSIASRGKVSNNILCPNARIPWAIINTTQPTLGSNPRPRTLYSIDPRLLRRAIHDAVMPTRSNKLILAQDISVTP
jgi:hypothetical protein